MRRVLAIAVAAALACAFALVTTPAQAATSWHLTVYYTAVESYHHDARVSVTGCRGLDCSHGHAALGRYPRSFVTAVRNEGTGRITSGAFRGRYLNWSYDVGYWLDTAPRDSYGHRLRPFVTAAADPSVLHRGSGFTITRCGHDTDSGDALDRAACSRLRAAHWRVQDEFTPGHGGARHVDLYIGEERGLHFEARSPLYLDASGAALRVTPTPTAQAAVARSVPGPTASTSAAPSPSASATASPTGATVQPVADPTPTATDSASMDASTFDDDFSGYRTDPWTPGEVGPWNLVWTGYGEVRPVAGSGLRLAPAAAGSPDETHSALVTSNAAYADLDATWTYRTVSQQRTGSSPNPWEVGWVLWHYTDNSHFYYVLLKPDGWELGKEDPAYPGSQRFLATGPGSFPVGDTYVVRVQQTGATMAVAVDGQPLVTFTDEERPYLSGSLGLYDEDSVTDYSRVTARSL